MTISLKIYLGEDCNGYGPNNEPPADYYSSRRIRPLRAAKYYGSSFIPYRHPWSDFHVEHFRRHLGPRFLQFPCPDPPNFPFVTHSPRSVDDVKAILRPAVFELVNLASQVVSQRPFVCLLYSWTLKLDASKFLEVYRTIPPTHIMWDDLYQGLPDDCTVPRWSQLSVEEKGKALVDLLPLINHHMPEGHGISLENHQWDQSIPFNSEKFSNSTQVNQKVSGALRYFAFLGRRRYTLYRIAVQAIEGEDLELITYLVRNLVPPTEIIPYLPPYMCAENIAQITKEPKGAFAKGQLRQTLSALEPRWSKFCEAETDAEALIQVFMQLSPAFPELLPENSELRSADFDRVILTSGYRARCIPGFFPDGACISAQCSTLEADERVNRIPGEIGFTWDIDVISDPKLENPFTLDAIVKVYTYSNQHNTKYGYLLTDGSLLVSRRCEKEPGIPRNGHIEISKTFWVGYNANLALFYLHLLASDPTKWKLPSNLWNGSSRLFDIYDLETFIDQW